MQAAFGEFFRVEQLILSTTNSSRSPHRSPSGLPSIVTPANIKLLFAMQAQVDALYANGTQGPLKQPISSRLGTSQHLKGAGVSLQDICYKPLGTACAIESVLQYWQMRKEVYEHGLPGQASDSSHMPTHMITHTGTLINKAAYQWTSTEWSLSPECSGPSRQR